jgi:hypothetical protein
MTSFNYSDVKKRLKQIAKARDVPKEHHYSITIWESYSYTTQGDERSRTNPGHGYPSETINVDTPRQFVTTVEEDWKEALRLLFAEKPNRDDVVALEVTRRVFPTLKIEVMT